MKRKVDWLVIITIILSLLIAAEIGIYVARQNQPGKAPAKAVYQMEVL